MSPLALVVTSHRSERVPRLPGRVNVPVHTPAVGLVPSELHLPSEASVVAVLRDDRVLRPETSEPLAPEDLVLALGRTETLFRLDRLFAAQVRPIHREAGEALGDFPIDPTATIGAIVDFYGLPAGVDIRGQTAEAYVARRLGRVAQCEEPAGVDLEPSGDGDVEGPLVGGADVPDLDRDVEQHGEVRDEPADCPRQDLADLIRF